MVSPQPFLRIANVQSCSLLDKQVENSSLHINSSLRNVLRECVHLSHEQGQRTVPGLSQGVHGGAVLEEAIHEVEAVAFDCVVESMRASRVDVKGGYASLLQDGVDALDVGLGLLWRHDGLGFLSWGYVLRRVSETAVFSRHIAITERATSKARAEATKLILLDCFFHHSYL